MNKTFLTAVSAIALMASAPAVAETAAKTSAEANVQYTAETGEEVPAASKTGDLSKDVDKAWENTKDDISAAADNVSEATEEMYEDAKHAMSDDDEKTDVKKISINPRITASGMIGQPVYDANGERVAKVHDIILSEHGQAEMVILADGDFTGLGKTVAFDYDVITKRSTEGDLMAPLSEEMIDQAASFSYEADAQGENVRIIPQNGYSVSELLDSEVTDPQGEVLASVDDLVFRNGQADQVVVSFGQVLGLGGEQAAISFTDAELMRNDNGIDFQLSASETTQFKQFKNSATN